MPRRPASVTQADIARAIRAMKAEGFDAVQIVFRDGGVLVQPAEREARDKLKPYEEVAEDDEVMIL